MHYMYPPPGFGYKVEENNYQMEEMKLRARQQAQRLLRQQEQAALSMSRRTRMESYGAIGQERAGKARVTAPHAGGVDAYRVPEPIAPLRPTYDRPVHEAPVYAYERPITPHDTYRYPDAHIDNTFAAAAAAPVVQPDLAMQIEQLNHEALATWYAEQVVTLLVRPGSYRAGAGGAEEQVWSDEGRMVAGWERVGVHLPQGMAFWADTPPLAPGAVRGQTPMDRHDPWNLLWKNQGAVSPRLMLFIYEILQRMSCSPSHVVAAVWYLNGLGLHEGDPKGAALRSLLHSALADPTADPEAVERRVALLGLVLAGKWFDDNSFQTKSWAEVTAIKAMEINKLEAAALHDLHWSLMITLPQWLEHVHGKWAYLMQCLESLSPSDSIVLCLLDRLETDARSAEMQLAERAYERSVMMQSQAQAQAQVAMPTPPRGDAPRSLLRGEYEWVDERLEGLYANPVGGGVLEYVDTAAQVQDEREVDLLVPYVASPAPTQMLHPHDVDVSDRYSSALVVEHDDDYMCGDEDDHGNDNDDDDDDDEFLEYDGAKRWLPSMAELRRSASNASASARSEAMDSLEAWRAGVAGEVEGTVGVLDSMPASPLPRGHYEYAAARDDSPFAFSAPSLPASPAVALVGNTNADVAPTASFQREISPALAALAELYASRPATGTGTGTATGNDSGLCRANEGYSPFRDGAPDAIITAPPVDFDFDEDFEQEDDDDNNDEARGCTSAVYSPQVPRAASLAPAAAVAAADGCACAYARFKETGVHFEPGISQVRPGTAIGTATDGRDARKPRLVHLDPMTLRPLDPNAGVPADADADETSANTAPQIARNHSSSSSSSAMVYVYHPYQCSYERERERGRGRGRGKGADAYVPARMGVAGWY